MFVSCEYCVLSGSCLCEELITNPGSLCVIPQVGGAMARVVPQRDRNKGKNCCFTNT